MSILLAFCLASPALAPLEPLSPAPQRVNIERASANLSWEQLLERDKRVSFTQRADGDALIELSDEELEDPRRAVALFALGTARRDDSAALLIDSSRKGAMIVKKAAMLALGEAQLVESWLLEEWMTEADSELREYAILAGLIGHEPETRTIIQDILATDGHELAETVERLSMFVLDLERSEASPASRLYLELRYEAARHFGLIDGQSWGVLVMEAVVRDDAFLDGVILPAAARLFANGIEDHLLHALMDGQGQARIEAAMIAMPEVVGKLVEHGFWIPADDSEWDAVLETIWDNRLEEDSGAVLVKALDFPRQRRQAAACIARLKDKEPARVLQPSVIDLADSRVLDRSWAIEFLVQLGEENAPERILNFVSDESPIVRMKALIALLRLDVPGAEKDLFDVFTEGTGIERESALTELCDQVPQTYVSRFLTDLVETESLGLEQRIRVGSYLILGGRGTNHSQYSEDIRSIPIEGELGGLILTALASRGLAEDLAYLEEHFPMEDDMVVNLAAARALVDRNAPAILPVLQAAMWRGPWDRSILACALLIENAGFRALKDELDQPPPQATSKDLRRVGFALGEWGGMEKVELFARRLRTGTGDPILQGALLGALSARTH